MTQHHYTPSHFLKLALFLHFYSLTNLQLSFFFYNIKPFSWLMPHYATVHLTYSKGKTHLHPPLTSASTSGCQTRFILIVYFLSSFYCVEMISFSFVWMSLCSAQQKRRTFSNLVDIQSLKHVYQTSSGKLYYSFLTKITNNKNFIFPVSQNHFV